MESTLLSRTTKEAFLSTDTSHLPLRDKNQKTYLKSPPELWGHPRLQGLEQGEGKETLLRVSGTLVNISTRPPSLFPDTLNQGAFSKHPVLYGCGPCCLLPAFCPGGWLCYQTLQYDSACLEGTQDCGTCFDYQNEPSAMCL